VNVLYGSATGLTAGGDQFWSQDSPGVKGVGRASERFGAALASGDFDRDGFADLAISVLREGVVNVLYGSSTGLTAEGDQSWSAAALALSAQISHLAGSLASGDFDGDGCWDLAIEASAVSAVGVDDFDPGRVVVVRGGGDGLRATDPVVLDRSMTRASTPGDVYHTFGSSLAAGDLDGDGTTTSQSAQDSMTTMSRTTTSASSTAPRVASQAREAVLGARSTSVMHGARGTSSGSPWPSATLTRTGSVISRSACRWPRSQVPKSRIHMGLSRSSVARPTD